MKRCLLIITVMLLGGVSASAQDIYFPVKNGTTLRYDYCDGQGKVLGYVRHTVTGVASGDSGITVSYLSERFSPQMQLLRTERFTSMQSKSGFLLGFNRDIFTSLNGTRVARTASDFVFAESRMSSLSVKAGTFLCYEQMFESNDLFLQAGIKPFLYRVWLSKDVGIVKVEGYDTRGKREAYLELAEISQQPQDAKASLPVVINLQNQQKTPVVINLQTP